MAGMTPMGGVNLHPSQNRWKLRKIVVRKGPKATELCCYEAQRREPEDLCADEIGQDPSEFVMDAG